MDRHKDKSRGVTSRLTVVETGQRRRWSDAEKRRIVGESLAGHRQVSATAQHLDLAVVKWRHALLGNPAAPESATLVGIYDY